MLRTRHLHALGVGREVEVLPARVAQAVAERIQRRAPVALVGAVADEDALVVGERPVDRLRGGQPVGRAGHVVGRRPPGSASPSSTSASAWPNSWPGNQVSSTAGTSSAHGSSTGAPGVDDDDRARVGRPRRARTSSSWRPGSASESRSKPSLSTSSVVPDDDDRDVGRRGEPPRRASSSSSSEACGGSTLSWKAVPASEVSRRRRAARGAATSVDLLARLERRPATPCCGGRMMPSARSAPGGSSSSRVEGHRAVERRALSARAPEAADDVLARGRRRAAARGPRPPRPRSSPRPRRRSPAR